MNPSDDVLAVRQVTKLFGRQKALDHISVSFAPGQSVAVLGPNGSGKTTFLKCLLGLTLPDSGDILWKNESIKNQWQYRSQVGYMPQVGRYPDHIRVGQILEMLKEIRGINDHELDTDLISAFNLKAFINKPMRTLSGGMRQKVSACITFLFKPELLILDEPTAGLDPVSCEVFKEKVASEKVKGKLILITSHNLSDLEDLTSDLLYFIEGKKQLFLPMDELKAMTGETRLQRAIAKIMQAGISQPHI
jgi:Cu-processing system ATP-binding protein